MLGRRPEHAETGHTNPHKRYSSASKYKKVMRLRDREHNIQGDRNQKIAKEIVKMARHLWCGIKLEDLESAGFAGRKKRGTPLLFSRWEGSFYHLQKTIEARAQSAGVRVVYVDPAFTSQCCNRCGERGIREGKEFFCPHCGYADHADVNAAFNIASAPPGTGARV